MFLIEFFWMAYGELVFQVLARGKCSVFVVCFDVNGLMVLMMVAVVFVEVESQ